MKKKFTFYDLYLKKRLLGLFFLLLFCNKNYGQTFCRPISNTNNISGLACVGSTLTNPSGAYDDDASLTTFASLNTTLGVFCTVQETMTFNQTASTGDQIAMYIGSGPSVLSLSLLSSVKIQAKLNGVNVGPEMAISNLLSLSVLGSPTVGLVKFTLPGNANQVQFLVGGAVTALTEFRIYDVRLEFAKPTVSGGLNQTICSGTSTTLSATPVVGTSLAWYSSPTSTTALISGNSFTTPVLTSNATYYIGVTRAAGCESNERVPVVINVSNPIAPVISSSGTAICSGGATQQTTLSIINPIGGTTYKWYSVPNGGTVLSSSNSYSPIVPVGTTSFYVEASIGTCISSTRTKVDVTSVAIPDVPTVLTKSVTIQSGQNATLNATTSQVDVVLNWYETATGGTPIATNSTVFTTPILTASKTYYVEAQTSTGGCVSASRVAVVVTVQPSSLGGCLEANSQQTLQNGLCLFCSSTTPNNSVDGNINTAARLSVPVGLLNGWIQQTLQFNNSGKAGDIIEVELGLPVGVLDLTALSYISLATYNGVTYNNDKVSINSLLNVQLLGGNRFKATITAGANFDRVEIRLGGLATVLTSLDIYRATYKYKAPSISGSTTICSGETTTLTASAAVGETIKWFDAATAGNEIVSTAGAITTPTLTTATTYYVEITRNGCANSERFPVLISVNNPVTPTVSASPPNLCAGQTTVLTVQSPVSGTIYKWYDATTDGNLLFTGPTFTTPGLTTNTIYYVEAVVGGCSNSIRGQVNINVSPIPAVPTVASSTVVIPSGQVVTLQVSNPVAGIIYDWYDAATAGNLLVANSTSYIPSPALTANKSYYISARNLSDCLSVARAVINVIVTPPPVITSCLQVNGQAVFKGGILTGCLLCDSSNAPAAADGNDTTASNIFVVAGLVNDYIGQTLTFATPGKAGDIIDVELGIPGGIADITALSYITLRSNNGGTLNSDEVNIGSLISIQLLSSTRFKASFVASGDFTAVDVQLGGLATLVTSLDIYGASYRYKDTSITGNSAAICAGQPVSLVASSALGGETYNWFTVATGGTAVSSVATYNIPSLSSTTTYYLEVTRSGASCVNSVRQPVTVTVNPLAQASDITISSPIEASCVGKAVLTPTSPLAGAQFKYYADQNKTIPILNGDTGSVGQIYAIDPTTSALTVTGLTAAGAPYNYFVSVVSANRCENAIGNLKQVSVTYPTTSLLAVNSPLVGCGSVNLKDAITTFDASGNTTYTFYDSLNAVLTPAAATNITTGGFYTIQAQVAGDICPSTKQSVTVTINPLPSLTFSSSQSSVIPGTSVTLTAVSDGTVVWFDSMGNPLGGPIVTVGPLNAPGIHTYTVVATLGTCTKTGTILINVIDQNSCSLLTERVYAATQTSGSILTGGVSDGDNAVDGNPQTFSTITTGVGLLGIGTTWQSLQWPTTILKGTAVTIKLGSQYSGVTLGQGLSVIGTKRDGLGNPIDIGTLQSVSGSLLKLLSGDNSFEYTFVPANGTGPKDYDGIRIVSGAILSVAQNTKVFDAYYNKSVSTVSCTPGDIQDIFYGATDIGIGALTATVGVSNAWNVADNDVSTYATMYSGVGALVAADLTVQFKTPSVVTDTLRIVVSKPATLLTVNLLTGFSVQRYLGNVAVGTPIDKDSNLLSIKLLPGNTMSVVLVNSEPEPYDRVRIRLGGVAGVLDFLRVHTVERVANTQINGGDSDNKITVCPGTAVTLKIPVEACSTYVWYDSEVGGNVVATGATYTVPMTLASGIYKYYVQPLRYGCEALARGEVTIEVRASSPVNALTNITLNGDTITTICSLTGSVTLNTSLSGTPVIANPVYHWYKFDGTTAQSIIGETTAQLLVDGLVPGTYTYFVGVSGDNYCETAEADRKQITFTILRASDQNDLSVNNVTICHDLPVELTPTASLLTNPIFYWYLDNNKTKPIANGATIDGVTYAISTSGILTPTGITLAMSPMTYYVAVSSDTTCPNIAGTLQTATVIITDPGTPVITKTTQDFCLINAPTFATIDVSPANATDIVWYNSLGNVVPVTTALTTGIYYAALKDHGTLCESKVRLAITINVNDPLAPVITKTTQDFCLINAPTFASIDVSPAIAANIVWYDGLGNIIPNTTALTSGTYFAAVKDGTNCESTTRTSVTINVNDPLAPVITKTTQAFCLINAPTFASIDVSPAVAANIIWYDGLGNIIPNTTALTSGTYFAAVKDGTNCESTTRTSVTINVNDPLAPVITKTTQAFCLINAPTFASIDVSPAVAANIIWYDGLGNIIPNTTALTSGTYFAAVKDGTNCESTARTSVTITVTDPLAPVITKTTQDFCLINAPTFASIDVSPAVAANIIWYDGLGNIIPNTTALTSGTYFAAVKDGTNCESTTRTSVTITVTDPLAPVITKTTQDFCLINAPTFASIDVSPAVAANIVWYDGLGNIIPNTTALTSGTYFAAVKDGTNCESTTRTSVTITVTDPLAPVITKTTQDFCLINAPTFASIDVSPAIAANIVWYDGLGNIIPNTTALTSGTYFAAVKDGTNCESTARTSVTITVTDPLAPVITKTTQDFCLINAPTFASIDVSPAIAANIVWYDGLGNIIPNTTALTSGTYFAAVKDGTNCESTTRTSVTITVTDPLAPVITKTTQDFCLINAPTFASIDVSPAVAANIVWYDGLGNIIPNTTALTSGTYFAAVKDGTNCESTARTSVTITVTDPLAPVITKTTQDFCLINAPTFASIDVSPAVAANIIWYDGLGNIIPNTTALTSGTYFAAVKDGTNCESTTRTSVTITVTDPLAPVITKTTQDFCLINAPTFASIDVSPAVAANIVWYDGLGNIIPNTTALTSGTYFAAVKDGTNCESTTRTSVTITVTDPLAPVITKTTQDFCLINAPTFASIDVSPAIAANIVWYDGLGNIIPNTTTLTSGTYFAAVKDGTNCESTARTSVTINVNDPLAPVITKTAQDFCLINAPTFASIDVSPAVAANIVWYDGLGNIIPNTTALTSGTYFAAVKDGTNCESTARTSVTINVNDPLAPVITKTTQDFCLINAPTFASIDVSPAIAANIVWYDGLGNIIPNTTALTSGTYFAAVKDGTNCESTARTSVTINVNDPLAPVITKATQDFCLINAPTFASIDVSPAVAANIVWYDGLGNIIPNTTTLTSGTYFAAVKDGTNCESTARTSVTISVTDPGIPSSADLTQDFCLINESTVASIQIDTPAIGTIIWYNAKTGGAVIPSATALITGSYFASILDPTTTCESAVRLEIAVNVTDPGKPTTGDTTQDFCLVNAPTVANIQVDAPTTGNIVWYTALKGGTVIPGTTALTNGSYFASILNTTTGCESAERLEVVITVTNPLTPSTTLTSQVFCSGNNPTVASIQVNETNVLWYNASSGGTAIPATTALVNGDYFGVIKDPITGCESSIRLKVTVTVGNTINPTTTNTAQNFCSVNAPTVASIQVNESNVLWYTASTGGTAIPATTALTSGIYFGNIIDALTGCESSTRLMVTVTVTDPSPTPTTNSVIQNFCSANSPKVSDIQVNEANVIWYSTPTGGTAIPATTTLATGIYYGVISSVGCENPGRLAVTVNVNTPGVITTPRTAQVFCLSELPTLANILVNEPNVVFYTSATGGTPLAANTLLTATTYYAGALSNTTNGCDSTTRLGIAISFENDALVQLATTDDTPCVFQGVTYSIANGKSNYVWSVTNGTITSGGTTADGSATVSWSDIGPGKVTVTYTNTCDETTTKTLDVTVATCSDITITNTVSNPTPNFGDQVTFTITVNNVGEGSFINTLVSELLPSGYNLVSANTTSGTYDTGTQVWTIPTLASGQSVTLTVVAEVLSSGNYLNVATIEISTPLDVDASNNSASASVEPICLTVYNEFTPNNDGSNDLFRIDCIETYPNNELKVFNRYGALVYSKQHYENNWDGTANVSGVVNRGDMLPTGTYFYVITIGDGTVKKGWLSIMR